jgi:hypothetical protein
MSAPNKATWPTHPDGRPMKFGEMTLEQRRIVAAAAAKRVGAQLQAAAPAIGRVLAEFDAEQAKATGGQQ